MPRCLFESIPPFPLCGEAPTPCSSDLTRNTHGSDRSTRVKLVESRNLCAERASLDSRPWWETKILRVASSIRVVMSFIVHRVPRFLALASSA